MSFDEGAVYFSDQRLVAEGGVGGGVAGDSGVQYEDHFFRFVREFRHENDFIYR